MESHGLPGTLQEVSFTTSAEATRRYAELTADFNPIHLDAAFAAATPFGRPIAHGTMLLGFLLQALAKSFGGHCPAGELQARFVRPLAVGQTLRAGGRLVDPQAGLYDLFVETTEGVRTLEGSLRLQLPSANEPKGRDDVERD